MVPPASAPPAAHGGTRNAYVDLLRSSAIVAVVFGHWLATGVLYQDDHYIGVNALTVVSWGEWVTLALQVIPVFFLVGGYANAVSWARHHGEGEPWPAWVGDRVRRLLTPTCSYLAVIALVMLICQLAGVDPRDIEEAGWALALHLWFLGAYMVVLLGTPALYAAHRRWGLWVPALMALAAVVIGTGVVELGWHIVGWANYLLVWGCFHQLGFCWHDGLLAGRRRGAALATVAALALVALTWWGPYPVSMVGVPGAQIQNPSPPSPALLAFGLAQCGVAVTFESPVNRWLARHRRIRSAVDTAGALTMPVYLWQMAPIVIVIVAGYLRVFGQPPIGSALWWEQRPIWIALSGLVLALLLAVLAQVGRLNKRRHRRRGNAGSQTRTEPALLVVGVPIATVGITLLAIHGFAPDGRLAVASLAAVAAGLALVSVAPRDLRRFR